MSEAEELSTKTTCDEPLPGYGDLYENLKNKQPADIAQALEAEAARRPMPVQASRGIANPFKLIVDFLHRRKHVKDLGIHPVEIPWLELHVPRGCSGALKWKTSGNNEAGISLDVFGSGFGSGRKIAWSMESDIPARTSCLKCIQQLNVQVDLYSVHDSSGDRYEPCVNVVSARARQLLSWRDCPYCSRDIKSVDEFEYEHGPMIDLRAYDGKYTETFARDLTKPQSANLGIRLPAIASLPESGKLGLSFKRESQLSCNLVYEFASGHCYQPYWPVAGAADLPYWSST